MTLRSDDNAQDTLGYMLLMLVTFVVVSGFLIAMLSSDVERENLANTSYSEDYYWFSTEYPYDEDYTSRTVTWANSTTYQPDDDEMYDISLKYYTGFAEYTDRPVQVHFVRNGTSPDYVYILQDVPLWSNWYASVAMTEIYATHNTSYNGRNITIVPFSLNTTYVLKFETDDADDHLEKIQDDMDFRLYVGVYITMVPEDETGFWSILFGFFDYIWRIYTFQSLTDDIPWALSMLISVSVWIATAYVTFMVVVRILHGGG